MSKTPTIDRVLGLVQDVADIAGLGARVAGVVRDVASPEGRQRIKTEVAQRGDRVAADRARRSARDKKK